ncbi:MAG: hypothetical protein HQL86_00585 [Magnetococcales bacterium]|nr:hypothetical protein [Magnetococcales bacterium]
MARIGCQAIAKQPLNLEFDTRFAGRIEHQTSGISCDKKQRILDILLENDCKTLLKKICCITATCIHTYKIADSFDLANFAISRINTL